MMYRIRGSREGVFKLSTNMYSDCRCQFLNSSPFKYLVTRNSWIRLRNSVLFGRLARVPRWATSNCRSVVQVLAWWETTEVRNDASLVTAYYLKGKIYILGGKGFFWGPVNFSFMNRAKSFLEAWKYSTQCLIFRLKFLPLQWGGWS